MRKQSYEKAVSSNAAAERPMQRAQEQIASFPAPGNAEERNVYDQVSGHLLQRAAAEERSLGTQSVPAQMSSGPAAQLYSETKSTHSSDVDKVWAARGKMNLQAKSYMTHNVAVDYNDKTNYDRSNSSSHAEPKVLSMYLADRRGTGEINLISERQPCRPCEDYMKKVEKRAKPKLSIDVDYFIPYTKGAGKEPLIEYYKKKGKLKG